MDLYRKSSEKREGECLFYAKLSFLNHLCRYSREVYTPPNADKEAVEDVSLFAPPFDNMAVVAQTHEDNALSLLHLGDHEGNRRTIVARTSVDKDRQHRGVSAVAALPSSGSSLSFVSAGYDHVMHLWSFDQDSISDEQPPIAGILDFQHTSVVQSLLPKNLYRLLLKMLLLPTHPPPRRTLSLQHQSYPNQTLLSSLLRCKKSRKLEQEFY